MLSQGDPTIILRIIISLYDNRYVKACYKLFKTFYKFIAGNNFEYGYSYMALCCWELGHHEEFLHYLRMAVERNPYEAGLVLSNLFPEDMDIKEYLQYAESHLKS